MSSSAAEPGSARPAAAQSKSIVRRAAGLPFDALRTAVGLVVNPIFLKELTVSSRRKRTYWLRAAYLLMLVLALLMTWWVMSQGSMSNSASEMLMLQSQTGQGLSLTLGWIQLAALLLVAPMLTGSCVSDEIEDRSLDVLLITPLSAGQIIIGKMLSRFVYVLLLVALGFPLLLAMRTYGGFSLEQLVRVEVLALTSALLGASVAMVLSCWEARGWRAVAMTYFWLAIWWFALPLIVVAGLYAVVAFVKPFMPWIPTDSWFFDWEAYPFFMMHTNPVMTMFLLTLEAVGELPAMWPAQFAWRTANAINVGLSAALLLAAVPLLRRTASKSHGAGDERAVRWLRRLLRPRARAEVLPAPSAAAAGAAPASSEPNGDASAPATVLAAPRRDLPVPRVWDHPILWREMRFAFLRRPILTGVVSLVLLLMLIWYNLAAELRRDVEMLIPLMFLALVAQLMIACVVSPTVIGSEKQARSWDVLLCVPISPLRILWSKGLGSLKFAVLPLIVLILEMIFYSNRHEQLLLAALLVAIFSLAASVFLACTGVALSLLCRRSLTAMAANLGLAIFLWGALPAVVGIISELRQWGGGSDDALWASVLINPFYWMTIVAEFVDSASRRGWPAFRLGFGRVELSAAEFTALAAFGGAAVIGAGFGLLYACAAWFNRITGRSS